MLNLILKTVADAETDYKDNTIFGMCWWVL